jgi:hypothetical protein
MLMLEAALPSAALADTGRSLLVSERNSLAITTQQQAERID